MPLTDPVPSSSFDVLQRNVQDTDKFVNQETGTFTNRVGKVIKPIPVIESEANAAVISLGWTPSGEFATGFTYTKLNDVGRDSLGSWWRYNGSDLPKVITAGTVPSSPNFSVISFETADNVQWKVGKSVGYALDDLQGFTEELFAQAGIVPNGSPDKLGASQRVDAIKQLEKAASKVAKNGGGSVQDFIDAQYATVADVATGKFKVGTYVRLTDRALRLFLLQSGGVADGYGILNAANGNTAVYSDDIADVVGFGAVGGSTNDTSAFANALTAGNGYAFVPYREDGYTVDGNLEGLWGFGNIRLGGNGLVRYTDVAMYDGYKNAAFYGDVLARDGNLQISCFGDSTMYGYQVGGATSDVQDVNNPPIILAVTLRALFSGDITVWNEAISGSNMRNMMRDLRYEGKIAPGGTSAGSQVIYCNHCINNVQSNYSIDEFKKDYIDFVRITRKYGKVPVIVTPNPIVPILSGDAIKTRVIETYVNAMRDVAKITGCDIVDNYYYAMRTASRVPLTEMVPDGIHPSSQLYLQNGRNLAIPLISAATLSSRGDVANIYSCSMRDTAISGISQQAGTLAGLNYTSTRNNSTETGIKFAALFDEKIEYLALHALHWESGAKVKVRSHNHNTTAYWQTVNFFRQYGNADSLIWDTPFIVKSNGDSYAGLHVIECTYDLTDTDASNQMALNCVSLPSQFAQTMSKIDSGGRYSLLTNALLTNQTMSLNFNFTLGGTGLLLADLSGYQALKIELTSGGAITATYAGTFGSATDTIVASGAAAGTKAVFVKVEPKQVTVNVDGVQVIRPITSWMPPLKIFNGGYVGLVTNN